MAFWQPNTISDVNIGTTANDGTGDDIRTAFTKVDNNFSNVSQFLSSTTYSFLNANVSQLLNTNYFNAANIFVANLTGTNTSITSNITAGNLISNTGLYSSGTSNFTGNAYVRNIDVNGTLAVNSNVRISAGLIPSANLTYDLGDATHWFNNLYVKGIQQVNTVTASSDAGLLTLHANLNTSDVKDVGVYGKFYTGAANNYAFFGHQQSTSNFVYKITPTDWTLTTSVVSDGVYGNVQFGSLFLSNATSGGNTLIVTGNASVIGNVYAPTHYGNIIATVANISRMNVSGNVSGNLYVDGAVYSAGYAVATLGTSGIGPLYSGGSITGITSFISATPSTSTLTGAVSIPYGGLGVGGNIVAGGFVGPLYGAVQTAAQPNITSLGTLTGLTVSGAGTVSTGTLQASQVNATNMLATSSVTFQSTVNGITTLTAATVNAVTIGNTGTTLTGTVSTAAQPNITSVGTLTGLTTSGTIIASIVNAGTIGNTGASHIGASATLTGTLVATTVQAGTIGNTGATLTGTLNTAAQTGITSVGTLTGLTTSGNTIVNSTVYAQGVYDNSNRVVSTSTGVGNLTVNSNGSAYLTQTGPGAATTGSATAIPVITTDAYGRIASISTAAVSSTLNLAGTTGTGTVALTSQSLTFAGSNGMTASASGQTITVSIPTTASPTFASPNFTGTATASVINAGTIGNASAVLYGTLNSSSAAQTNITSVGLLTGLSVSGDIKPSSNVTVNLGDSTHWFNTLYGTSSHALYADLAEKYTSDADYEPGTVVVFGGEKEITTTTQFADVSVAGAISTDPAYLMNAMENGLPVALRGRIPVKVIGPVTKGDLLVTSADPGFAISIGKSTEYPLAVFAKSIETNTAEGIKIITAVIL